VVASTRLIANGNGCKGSRMAPGEQVTDVPRRRGVYYASPIVPFAALALRRFAAAARSLPSASPPIDELDHSGLRRFFGLALRRIGHPRNLALTLALKNDPAKELRCHALRRTMNVNGCASGMTSTSALRLASRSQPASRARACRVGGLKKARSPASIQPIAVPCEASRNVRPALALLQQPGLGLHT